MVEHTFVAQGIKSNVGVDEDTGSDGVLWIDEYLGLYPNFPPEMKVPAGSVQSQFVMDHKIMLVYNSGVSTDPCVYSDARKVLKILRDQLQNDPDTNTGGLLHATAFLGQGKNIEFFVCDSADSLWDAEHVEPFAIEDGHYYANDVLSSTDCAAVFFQAARWAATFDPRATLPKNMDESFASSTIALRVELREDWNEGKVTWPTYGHLRDLMRNLPGEMPGVTLQSWRGTTGEISIRREGSSLHFLDYVPKGYLQLSQGIAPPRTSSASNLTDTSRGSNSTELNSVCEN